MEAATISYTIKKKVQKSEFKLLLLIFNLYYMVQQEILQINKGYPIY